MPASVVTAQCSSDSGSKKDILTPALTVLSIDPRAPPLAPHLRSLNHGMLAAKNATLSQSIITDADASALEDIIFLVGVEGLCYGGCVILGFMSSYVLIRKKGSSPRRFLLLIVLSLFVSSTISYGNTLVFYVAQIRSMAMSGYNQMPAVTRTSIFKEICTRANFILGDTVVVWRTWFLSNLNPGSANRATKILLVLSYLATIALVFCDMTLTVKAILKSPVGISSLSGAKSLILPLPLLVTNILSILLVAFVAWNYRKHIKLMANTGDKGSSVERILLLLLQSGSIYCIILILTLIARLDIWGDLGHAVLSALNPYLTNAYPTIIILLASTHMSETKCLHGDDVTSRCINVSRPMTFEPRNLRSSSITSHALRPGVAPEYCSFASPADSGLQKLGPSTICDNIPLGKIVSRQSIRDRKLGTYSFHSVRDLFLNRGIEDMSKPYQV
ncbi:hypothetical protein K435DRAFT_856603 [Dendrothele bispora CBS 962.96]|uniref:Uncharacterized protein n=1 Tax=Dendrothele bispora (strain CBS 962.96) TaxID=1314807 RepID=A0A4S8M808_DENBC|nr:hypothetical protein K435DRAFT_856603 [Dendrothele bispora CBS 962.96]